MKHIDTIEGKVFTSSSLCLGSPGGSSLFIKLDRNRIDTMPDVLLRQPFSPERVSLVSTTVRAKNLFAGCTE